MIQPDFATLPRQAEGRCLVGLTREGLSSALVKIGVPERQVKMRASQLWSWIYQKGVADFAAMTNLSKGFR
ncbi:MAG: 23S rRNA (adenine(2503)-C(2))-methyltransferase RlmN, partial [Pseudomonadota bacterium]